MAAKRNLDQMIASSQPGHLEVNRGQGFTLSTSRPDTEIEETTPEPVIPKQPQVLRESAKVDKRLIREYKLLAAQENRKIYEVMEEALKYWLDFHKGNSGNVEK
jgi:hypothetical protein